MLSAKKKHQLEGGFKPIKEFESKLTCSSSRSGFFLKPKLSQLNIYIYIYIKIYCRYVKGRCLRWTMMDLQYPGWAIFGLTKK